MLSIIKLRVHLGYMRVTFKFIVCESSVTSTIIGADFGDQHVGTIRPKKRLA